MTLNVEVRLTDLRLTYYVVVFVADHA